MGSDEELLVKARMEVDRLARMQPPVLAFSLRCEPYVMRDPHLLDVYPTYGKQGYRIVAEWVAVVFRQSRSLTCPELAILR